MLRVQLYDSLDEISEENVIFDIESEFAKISLDLTFAERVLVKKIDGGNLIYKDSFIDQFGFKMRLSELSTGCKAALLVLHTDSWVSLQECRTIARDSIIKYCKSGNILLPRRYTHVNDHRFNQTIDVVIGDRLFVSITELNRYLKEARYVAV